MEFRKLNIDALTLVAGLVSREAADRDPALGAALRRIEVAEVGRYGEGRPDVRLTIALAPGLEASVDTRWLGEDASSSMLVDAVDELVGDAERIFNDRHGTVDLLKEIRATLSRETSKARRRGLPYGATDVSLTPCEAGLDDLPAVAVGVEVIGPLLDPERIAFDAESGEDVVQAFAEWRETQEQRLAMRSELSRLGADVMIDSVTLAAIEGSGIVPARAIADLRANEIRIIDFDVTHGRMVLYVRDGVVTGNVPLGDGMRWQEGRLTVPKALGLALDGARGQPLKRVLTHDYFDDTATLASAGEIGDSVWLHVRTQPVALSLDERRRAA